MKFIKRWIIMSFILVAFSTVNTLSAQPGVTVNINTFYNDLRPYGRWLDHPSFGRVWIYNEPGFRPYYTNGHWEYTDYGWEWASDYEWGYEPFHFGRWEEDPSIGWFWIPDTEWAPAWVSWSQYDDYYGWAPLGYGATFSINIGSIPFNRWVYAPRTYITSRNLSSYYLPFERSRSFSRNSVRIDNYYSGGGRRFQMGPDRDEVERYTHSRIEPRRIENNRFGNGDGVYGNQRQGWDQRGNNSGFRGGERYPANGQQNNQGWDNRRNDNNQGWNNRRNENTNIPQVTIPQNNRENDNQRRDWNNRGNYGGQQQQIPQQAPRQVPPSSQGSDNQNRRSWNERGNGVNQGNNNSNWNRQENRTPEARPQAQPRQENSGGQPRQQWGNRQGNENQGNGGNNREGNGENNRGGRRF